jgi:hypothetical protein
VEANNFPVFRLKIGGFVAINPEKLIEIFSFLLLYTLKKVLERNKDDHVSVMSVRNPNCPSEALHMVLERNKDDQVSKNAVHNPNCSPSARLKWLQNTNLIGQNREEDYNPNKTDYSDLDELENLL